MFKRIKNWLTPEETFALQILFKSGNAIVIDKVAEYKFDYRENEITGVALRQTPKAKNRLLVGTIALDQIESVVRIGGSD